MRSLPRSPCAALLTNATAQTLHHKLTPYCAGTFAAAFSPFVFFLSSTNSMLSSGISLYFSKRNSSISSLRSPCTVISSPPPGSLVTLAPVANFLPKSLDTFLISRPNASSPLTAVTYLRLLRSMRLIVILLAARVSASRFSADAALFAFLAASFSARFWASTESVERFCASASVGVLGRRC